VDLDRVARPFQRQIARPLHRHPGSSPGPPTTREDGRANAQHLGRGSAATHDPLELVRRGPPLAELRPAA
jgi:hypothetical protein